jgi:hypothetical protein
MRHVDVQDGAPVPPAIFVSPTPYRLVLVAGAVAFAALLILGGSAGTTAGGIGGLAAVALFGLGARDRLRGDGAPALSRRGDELVGSALREPLPVAGTAFAIVDDHQGSWLIELHHGGRTVRLSAGGWRVQGEGRVTRARAPQVLERLGLHRLD